MRKQRSYRFFRPSIRVSSNEDGRLRPPLTPPRNRDLVPTLNLRYWKTRLNTDQSKASRSRFSNASASSPLYRIVYLGENHQVVIYEVGALLGNPNAPCLSPKGSWMLLSLQVTLHHVADLCDLEPTETYLDERPGNDGCVGEQFRGGTYPATRCRPLRGSSSGGLCISLFQGEKPQPGDLPG